MGRPPKNASPEATTDRVLAAAEVAFGAHGLQRARLGDIADAAGIRRSSLLYHFPSKEALYGAVVVRAFAELRAAVAEALGGGPAEAAAALDRIVCRLLAFGDQRPALVSVVLRELVDPSGAGQVQREFGGLVRVLERALRTVAGPEWFRPDFPVRGAILQLISGYLVRHAALASRPASDEEAPVQPAGTDARVNAAGWSADLWGDADQTRALAHALILGGRALAPGADANARLATPSGLASATLNPDDEPVETLQPCGPAAPSP